MMRSASVAIIGAGGIGAHLAYLLSEQQIADHILMYDPNIGLALGKALDISEALPIRRRRVGVKGVEGLTDVITSDVIVWALEPPHSALTNAVHYTTNDQAQALLVLLSNYTGILVVATHPNDALVAQFTRSSALPSRSIIGLGTLPSARAVSHTIATTLNIDEHQIHTIVVGRWPSPYLVPSLATINGIPLSAVSDIDTTLAPEEVLFSDPFNIASIAAEVIEAIVYDLRRPLVVATEIDRPGMQGVYSWPAIIGSSGVLRTLPLPLTKNEEAELHSRIRKGFKKDTKKDK